MKKTNFDHYLEEQMQDEDFARRFRAAGKAWDVALQLTKLREQAGLTQKELALRAGTTQQQISRMESSNYEGHSLQMLRRIAEALDAEFTVHFRRRPQASLQRSRKKTGAEGPAKSLPLKP